MSNFDLDGLLARRRYRANDGPPFLSPEELLERTLVTYPEQDVPSDVIADALVELFRRVQRAVAALATDWPWRAVKNELPKLGQRCLLLLADGSILFGSYEYNYDSAYYSWSTSVWEVEKDPNPALFWIYAQDIPQPKLPQESSL